MAGKSSKQYLLMHKNVPVAELALDTASGAISAMPFMTLTKNSGSWYETPCS